MFNTNLLFAVPIQMCFLLCNCIHLIYHLINNKNYKKRIFQFQYIIYVVIKLNFSYNLEMRNMKNIYNQCLLFHCNLTVCTISFEVKCDVYL